MQRARKKLFLDLMCNQNGTRGESKEDRGDGGKEGGKNGKEGGKEGGEEALGGGEGSKRERKEQEDDGDEQEPEMNEKGVNQLCCLVYVCVVCLERVCVRRKSVALSIFFVVLDQDVAKHDLVLRGGSLSARAHRRRAGPSPQARRAGNPTRGRDSKLLFFSDSRHMHAVHCLFIAESL